MSQFSKIFSSDLVAGTIKLQPGREPAGPSPGWVPLQVLIEEPGATDPFTTDQTVEYTYGFYTPYAEHWGDPVNAYATTRRTLRLPVGATGFGGRFVTVAGDPVPAGTAPPRAADPR